MTEIKTPADVLDEAAALLEVEGWCRGTFYNEATGHRCARGAIMAVAAPHELTRTAAHWLAEDLDLEHEGKIASWNDDERRTKRQVVSRMRKVAKKIRSW